MWKADAAAGPTFRGPRRSLHGLAWSPDSGRIVTASDGFNLHWFRLDGQSREVVTGRGTYDTLVRPVSWSPDGSQLTFPGRGASMDIWNVDGTAGRSWKTPGRQLLHALWSSDGEWLATYTFGDRNVRLWKPDGTHGPVIAGLPGVSRLLWSPDGQHLAIGSVNGSLYLANREGKVLKELEGHDHQIVVLTWSPDSRWLASSALEPENRIRLRSVSGTAGPVLEGHPSQVQALSWHPEGQLLASIDRKGVGRLWKSDGTSGPLLLGHTREGEDVTWSPDGKWLASSSSVEIRLWTKEGAPGAVILPNERAVIDKLAWSPDGVWLAAQIYNYAVRLWKPDGTAGVSLRGTNLEPKSLSWSPNSHRIACTTADNSLVVWDTTRGSTDWVGFVLPDDKTATLFSTGNLIGAVEDFDRRFVFLWQQPDGRLELQNWHQFSQSW